MFGVFWLLLESILDIFPFCCCLLFLDMLFDWCFIWFPIDFKTLTPHNATFYRAKTNSCLNSSFLKQIEISMISSSLLASFCHHLSCFSVTDFGCFSGLYFWRFRRNSDQKLYLNHCRGLLLATLFDIISTLFRKGVFEDSFARYGSLLDPLWLFWAPFSAPF